MTLKTTVGMHRFTWDVHYQPVDGVNRVGGAGQERLHVRHHLAAEELERAQPFGGARGRRSLGRGDLQTAQGHCQLCSHVRTFRRL